MHIWKLFQVREPLFFPDESSGNLGDVSDLGQDLEDLGGNADDENPDEEEVVPEDEENPDEEEEEEEEEEDPDKKVIKKDKKVKEEEEQEEEEEEEEEEDPDKDGEKPTVIEGRPTSKQLKETFGKDVFKKVPYLREAVFEYPKFKEQFDTPADAAEAATKALHYDEVNQSILEGKPEFLLNTIKTNNPELFKTYSVGMVKALRGMDSELYYDNVAEPVVKELLNHAFKHGEKKQNSNLMNAAKHIADYVFNNGGEVPNIEAETKKHPAEEALERERKERNDRDFSSANQDVNQRIDRSLTGFLNEGLSPRLSTIEKRYILDKTLDETIEKLNKDTAHGTRMRQLWRRAKTAGYSEQSKLAITTAHVARAKTLARETRDRLTQEALKGKRRPAGQEEKENQGKPKKRTFNTGGKGGSPNQRRGVLDPKQIDYRRTTDEDILFDNGGDRVKLKGSTK